MRNRPLSQRGRFIVLIFETALLCAVSRYAFGTFFPSLGPSGFWFYTALLGLILGSRLDTPHFVSPADAFLYATFAALALAYEGSGTTWHGWDLASYYLSLGFCLFIAAAGIVAILSQTRRSGGWQRVSDTSRVLCETFGTPAMIYSVVLAFAVVVYHRQHVREAVPIVVAWVVLAWVKPADRLIALFSRLAKIWRREYLVHADGTVASYESPGIFLLRFEAPKPLDHREVLAIRDASGATRVAIALEQVSDSEGSMVRALDVGSADAANAVAERARFLSANSFARLDNPEAAVTSQPIVQARKRIVGLVAEDTSIQRLFFNVMADAGIEEGRLVTVAIGQQPVLFQITNGSTREEVISLRNRYGFARAQARKIGVWDAQQQRFRHAKWMPMMNAPVVSEEAQAFQVQADPIGHFPASHFPVHLKTEGGQPVGLNAMVTHNTAIIGILGVGKSSLAIELLERMMTVGIKVVCIDLTNQYATALAPYYDAGRHEKLKARLNQVGRAGKTVYAKNQNDGGSVNTIATELEKTMTGFLRADNPRRLLVVNPAELEVWRQDGRVFKEGDVPGMSMATPAQITHLISESALDAVSKLGMTDQPRICIVYEEAHSLVPEWNSAVNDGDKAAANGTARAILQGRKYGLGCLLISQRTANVTKTILNQCNTVFAMRTFDDTGKEFLANYLGREYADILPTLEERHAIFFGRGSGCENPVMIRLNDREQWLAAFRQAHPPPALPADLPEPPPAAPAVPPAQ